MKQRGTARSRELCACAQKTGFRGAFAVQIKALPQIVSGGIRKFMVW